MRLLLVTDTWAPQVNGVVRTLTTLARALERRGHRVAVVEPSAFHAVPCPRYPSIRLALFPWWRVRRFFDATSPDAVHIATEGPLGWAARNLCLGRGVPFTTSYHSRFPEYLELYAGLSPRWAYRVLSRFHRPAARTLVPSPSIRDLLTERGFRDLVVWGRGVDLELFRPRNGDLPPALAGLPRPIFLNSGRVSVEKNLEAFARLDLPGSRVIVGDGPQLEKLRRRYPQIRMTGFLPDPELARCYAAADAFVFPSRTDTFGNVMLEALACGTPVAGYPVPGPLDVVEPGVSGVLHEDLAHAAKAALELDRRACRADAERRPWEPIVDQFLGCLESIG